MLVLVWYSNHVSSCLSRLNNIVIISVSRVWAFPTYAASMTMFHFRKEKTAYTWSTNHWHFILHGTSLLLYISMSFQKALLSTTFFLPQRRSFPLTIHNRSQYPEFVSKVKFVAAFRGTQNHFLFFRSVSSSTTGLLAWGPNPLSPFLQWGLLASAPGVSWSRYDPEVVGPRETAHMMLSSSFSLNIHSSVFGKVPFNVQLCQRLSFCLPVPPAPGCTLPSVRLWLSWPVSWVLSSCFSPYIFRLLLRVASHSHGCIHSVFYFLGRIVNILLCNREIFCAVSLIIMLPDGS